MISIIVLSYNHSDYIIETLRSACALELNKEIIIIDDGSTDNSVMLINDFITSCKSTEKIHLIEKENSGLVKSLNLGLKSAAGEDIYFIASDDLICPIDFKIMYEKFIKNAKAKMIIGNAWVYYANITCFKKCYLINHDDFFSLNDKEVRKRIFLDFPKPLLLQSVIFKRQALLGIGGWDENLIWDDYPMFVKLLYKYSVEEKEIVYSPQYVIAKYRQHNTNSYKNTAKQLAMLKQTFVKLVPSAILRQTLARQYAFYFLIALRNKDILVLKNITFEILKDKTFFVFVCYLFQQIYEWVKRKF